MFGIHVYTIIPNNAEMFLFSSTTFLTLHKHPNFSKIIFIQYFSYSRSVMCFILSPTHCRQHLLLDGGRQCGGDSAGRPALRLRGPSEQGPAEAVGALGPGLQPQSALPDRGEHASGAHVAAWHSRLPADHARLRAVPAGHALAPTLPAERREWDDVYNIILLLNFRQHF